MDTREEAVRMELNKPIELAKKLQRLFENPDFKAVYDAYTKDFLLSTTINIGRTANPAVKEGLHNKVDAIAGYIQFIDEIANDGKLAAEHLANLDAPEEDDGEEV